jgi:hypothetical protein
MFACELHDGISGRTIYVRHLNGSKTEIYQEPYPGS